MQVRCGVGPDIRMLGQRTGTSALAVEATRALLLGTLAARVYPGLVLAAACQLTLRGVPLACIAAAVHRLLDALTGSAFASTALPLIPTTATGANDRSWRGPS